MKRKWTDRNPLYRVGDQVRIVNYGSMGWKREEGDIETYDMNPEIVKKEGVICKVSVTQGRAEYAIEFGEEGIKYAWYYEDQMEMVFKHPFWKDR